MKKGRPSFMLSSRPGRLPGVRPGFSGSQKPLAGTRQRLRWTPSGQLPSLSERALLNGSGFELLPKGIKPQRAQDQASGSSFRGRGSGRGR